jgi:hypothetical protein
MSLSKTFSRPLRAYVEFAAGSCKTVTDYFTLNFLEPNTHSGEDNSKLINQ